MYKLQKSCLALLVWGALGLLPIVALAQGTDSTVTIKRDSISLKDTVPPKKDTIKKVPKKGDIETTITFYAQDSITLQVKTKSVTLYENAKVTYGDKQIEAATIHLDWNTNVVDAFPRKDTAGKTVGLPKFTEGETPYYMDSIKYNIKSQRAIIYGIQTKQGEGYLTGSKIKKTTDGEYYFRRGVYTTCNLKDPHFCIVAQRTKLTKNQNVITGPFHLEIADVPTPLAFAFGIFPRPQQKSSGVIVPEYGESRDNGFFLRGGGYYWGINDYMDLRLTGEIYTYGNWGINALFNYTKRYTFNGTFNFTYNTRFEDPTNDRNQNKLKQFSVNWSHSPQSKGTGRFSASVSAASSTFNRTSAFDIGNLVTNTLQSSVSYSKSFKGLPFFFTLSGRHNQDVTSNLVNINLPDFNFSVNRLFPFKPRKGTPKVKGLIGILHQINTSYAFNSSVQITNRIRGNRAAFPITEPVRNDSTYKFVPENFSLFLDKAQITARHSIPVSAPFKLLKFINGNLSFNFNQTFHPQSYVYNWEGLPGGVRIDTIRRWGTSYNYSMSAGGSTNIFGVYTFSGKRRLQAIRHQITPNISFSYSPDFSSDIFGFYQRNVIVGQNRETGEITVRDLPRFDGVPGAGRSGSIGFGISNRVEAKLASRSDSAGAKPEKITLLESFSASGSYNLLADPIRNPYALSNIGLAARNRIANMFDVNLSGTLDPYVYIDSVFEGRPDPVPTRIPTLAFDRNRTLGKIISANMSLSFSLNPGTFNKNKRQESSVNPNSTLINPLANVTNDPTQQTNVQTSPLMANDPTKYVAFDLPWSLAISYNLSYIRFPQIRYTQGLTFSGDLSLTPKWKLNFSSTYDFENKALGGTQLNFIRDLHCWQMSFNWTPLGQFQQYSFRINVVASTLRDLKLDRKRNWYDR